MVWVFRYTCVGVGVWGVHCFPCVIVLSVWVMIRIVPQHMLTIFGVSYLVANVVIVYPLCGPVAQLVRRVHRRSPYKQLLIDLWLYIGCVCISICMCIYICIYIYLCADSGVPESWGR